MDEWQTAPTKPWSDDDASWPDDATPPTPPDEPLPPRTPPPPREPRFSRGSSSREIDSIGVEDTLAQTLHSPVPPGQQAARGRDAVVDKSTGAERSRRQDRRGTRSSVAPPPPRTTLPPRGKISGKSKKSAGRKPGKAPLPARPSIAAPRENTPKRDKPRRPRRTAADVEAALNLGEFDGDTPREGAACQSPTASPRRLGDAFDFRGLGPEGDDAAVAATLPLSARDVGATLRGAPVRALPAPLLAARLTALDVSDCAHLKCSALAVLSRAAATLASLNCANAGLEALPDAWAALGRLETLDASRNRLHRWPANVFVHDGAATALAQNLRRLDLAQNDIVDAPPSVALLARLAHLDLRDNRLRTVDAAVFSATARVLDLSSNPDLVDLPPACASFKGQLIVRNNAQLTTPPQRVLENLEAPAFFRALSDGDRALDRSRRRAYLARRDAALLERLQAVERRAARRGGYPLPPGPPDAARLANLLLALQQQLELPPPPPPTPPRSSSMRSLSAAAAAAARRRAGGGLRRVASDAAVAEHTMAPTARSDLETARHALRRLGAGDDDADIEVLACFCLPESVVVKKRTVPLPPSAQLDLMREVAALVAAVPPREREIVPAARWPQDVLRALGSGERSLCPRIFHVSSHGVRKDAWWHASTSGTLLFHRRDGGAALPEREEVVDVLRQCGDGLELLFLNACASVDLAQYVAAKLPGLKVVCWRGRVHDACARFFARAFYAHVGERPGGDVAVAFSAAFARLRQEYVVGDPDPWPRPVACLGPAKRPQGLPVLVVV